MRQPARTGSWLRRTCAGLAMLMAAGCVSSPRIPYTDSEARHAEVAIAGVRTWGDEPDPAFAGRARAAFERGGRSGRATYLALSGGGGDGAFGAGILIGWTETGRRPDFTIVSGVSTGALMAPFAFLGPRYDPVIRELYTSGVAETLLSSPDPFRAIFGTSLFSNDRLRELVARYVTPEIVAEIARERAAGRVLLVVTTNLDSQRPVLWDMGAIAAEGSERAQNLFRDVLVASASIPAVFPPMLIDATSGDHAFQELHVDGTITSSVFTLPKSYLRERRAPGARGADLYVLMNAKLEADFNLVPETAPEIGTRTFSTFIKESARADIVDAYAVAKSRGYGFSVAYIGRDLPTQNGAGFDTAYMRRLFDYGYRQGRTGRFWHTAPPDAAPAAVASR